jgi:hypothetical protein
VLRSLDIEVIGTASHGDYLCRVRGYVNHNFFLECPRPNEWRRWPLEEFALKYEAYWLGYTHYIADNGGQWRYDIDERIDGFTQEGTQLQVSIHPQHWTL